MKVHNRDTDPREMIRRQSMPSGSVRERYGGWDRWIF